MKPTPDGDRLALQVEVAELRQQLAETQDQGVELAVDAGELHVQIQALQEELASRLSRPTDIGLKARSWLGRPHYLNAIVE